MSPPGKWDSGRADSRIPFFETRDSHALWIRPNVRGSIRGSYDADLFVGFRNPFGAQNAYGRTLGHIFHALCLWVHAVLVFPWTGEHCLDSRDQKCCSETEREPMTAQTSSAPTVSGQARSATGRYTYRAKALRPQHTDHTDHAKLAHALGVHRQLLSHATSAIRTLTAARNELMAQAIEDGLTIATVSAATGENMKAVRTIALAYDDLHPSGLPRNVHLSAMKQKSDELRAAERHRAQITERREALIVMALRNQVCDDLELASLTGLTPDHIRRSTRGIARPA
ncbi:hypothetical protein AAur_3910 [Paenarthrobacter aurescens TC1]|uniref:Uncharacterized protein n=2 Tax=Paenarthrobacter aurescens TaxID=43663 RepID=A1RBH4_PAEAT|nr:hypothetical protein AAur_3910 [Paenarthrobacter aurescens TC1]